MVVSDRRYLLESSMTDGGCGAAGRGGGHSAAPSRTVLGELTCTMRNYTTTRDVNVRRVRA